MSIEVDGNKYPIELSDINNFEKKYNINLPQDYKEFLLHNNGGIPRRSKFITKNGKYMSHFRFIMPLTKDVMNSQIKHNLEYCYINFIVTNKMPVGLLPFGETPSENILCLSIKDDEFGAVYFWDRELELVYKQSRSDCYHLIANSFSQFIEGLRERET